MQKGWRMPGHSTDLWDFCRSQPEAKPHGPSKSSLRAKERDRQQLVQASTRMIRNDMQITRCESCLRIALFFTGQVAGLGNAGVK